MAENESWTDEDGNRHVVVNGGADDAISQFCTAMVEHGKVPLEQVISGLAVTLVDAFSAMTHKQPTTDQDRLFAKVTEAMQARLAGWQANGSGAKN